ncbi:MAG: prepilin-type N-terminal cleavage/methylation domain-containing protein [Neisseriaceae bacterium]|nr:prepilin-type N-terminal cleavage/methylation domain-containing protein [Neisseriaceae bacterium]
MLGKKQHGFTLTELMIVVAVLAILAGIAIPSYSHFTKKAQLRKAQSALLENAHALEQVYAQKKGFADASNKGHIADTDKVGEVDGKGGRPFNEVPGNKFKITTTYTGTDKYEMKAEPTDNWKKETRYLILDNTGNLVCYDTKTSAVCKNF